MIDLSITNDPEWIKQRESLWKPIGADFKKDFRKKEVDKIHRYFMTGTLLEGERLSDGAKFSWFPLQTPEAWDYVLEYLFCSQDVERELKNKFHFQFGDLSQRAMSFGEELALWDYFAGDTFQPIFKSRVPVGPEKKIISFEVDHENVVSHFNLGMDGWFGGEYSSLPKWVQRFNYFLTMLPHMKSLEFVRLTNSGRLEIRVEALVSKIFKYIVTPPYGKYLPLSDEALEVRHEFAKDAVLKLDAVNMPPAMKKHWEDTKATHGG